MTLPSFLVTDTNIWIDLKNGNILEDVFQLPYKFFTSDFAVVEFISPSWDTLQKLGLQIYGLEPKSVIELGQLTQIHHQLSTSDLAALILAKAHGVGLLTGDRKLNELALAKGLTVHGVLWILDEMVNYQVLTVAQAAVALRKMLDQGARLPNTECQKRLERWSSSKDRGY